MEATAGVEIMSGKADKDEEVLSREYDSWDDVLLIVKSKCVRYEKPGCSLQSGFFLTA